MDTHRCSSHLQRVHSVPKYEFKWNSATGGLCIDYVDFICCNRTERHGNCNKNESDRIKHLYYTFAFSFAISLYLLLLLLESSWHGSIAILFAYSWAHFLEIFIKCINCTRKQHTQRYTHCMNLCTATYCCRHHHSVGNIECRRLSARC